MEGASAAAEEECLTAGTQRAQRSVPVACMVRFRTVSKTVEFRNISPMDEFMRLCASARAHHQDSVGEQRQSCRLGDCGISSGTRAAAGRLAEAGFREIVVALKSPGPAGIRHPNLKVTPKELSTI